MKKLILIVMLITTLTGCAGSFMGSPTKIETGTVVNVVLYQTQKTVPNVAGALIGAGLGGFAGNQFGRGNGNKAMTVGGVILGAGMGGQYNQTTKIEEVAQVTILLDNGNMANLTTENKNIFNGQKVIVEHYGNKIVLKNLY